MHKESHTRKIRILGIDPGSRITGYGVVDLWGSSMTHVEHGAIHLEKTNRASTIALETRIHDLFLELNQIIDRLKPQVLVVEKVFFAKNASSALKLGQARGIILLSGALHSLQIHEYSVTEVKQFLTGGGHAEKGQVARVVQLLLGQSNIKSLDASDALALAITHAHRISGQVLKQNQENTPQKSRGKKHSLAESVKHAVPLTKR